MNTKDIVQRLDDISKELWEFEGKMFVPADDRSVQHICNMVVNLKQRLEMSAPRTITSAAEYAADGIRTALKVAGSVKVHVADITYGHIYVWPKDGIATEGPYVVITQPRNATGMPDTVFKVMHDKIVGIEY